MRLEDDQRAALGGVLVALKDFWSAHATQQGQKLRNLEDAWEAFENTIYGPVKSVEEPAAPPASPTAVPDPAEVKQ